METTKIITRRLESKNDVKIENRIMSFEEFTSIPPWKTQRWEERLIKGNRCKVLLVCPDSMDKKAHEHMMKIVSIIVFPNGKGFIVNGNTRKCAYIKYKNRVQYKIPKEFFVTIHYIETNRQAQTIYDMYDPPESSKNSGERVTEAYRKLNILGNFQSHQGKWGIGYPTSAQMISNIPGSQFSMGRSKRMSTNDWQNFISSYKNELLYLDDMINNAPKYKNPAAEIKAAFLMFMKKYGIDNKRLNKGIKRYLEGRIERANSISPVDGITFINENENNKKLIKSGHDNRSRNINRIIYFLKRWMEDKPVKKLPKKHKSKERDDLIYYYKFFEEK